MRLALIQGASKFRQQQGILEKPLPSAASQLCKNRTFLFSSLSLSFAPDIVLSKATGLRKTFAV